MEHEVGDTEGYRVAWHDGISRHRNALFQEGTVKSYSYLDMLETYTVPQCPKYRVLNNNRMADNAQKHKNYTFKYISLFCNIKENAYADFIHKDWLDERSVTFISMRMQFSYFSNICR